MQIVQRNTPNKERYKYTPPRERPNLTNDIMRTGSSGSSSDFDIKMGAV